MKFSKIACDSMKSQFLSLRMRESIFLKPLELRVPSLDVCNINYNFLLIYFFVCILLQHPKKFTIYVFLGVINTCTVPRISSLIDEILLRFVLSHKLYIIIYA